MTEPTVDAVDPDRADGTAPPAGTAIVRPLCHVRAVRERYLQRFTDPAEAAGSPSVQAWAWALGETVVAPMTGRLTAIPPSRAEMEAEITEAEERRLRGSRKGRGDAAATVLRWLIGADDHVPVRGANPGELVGGFGDIIRTRQQLADLVMLARAAQRDAAAKSLDTSAASVDRERARREAGYLDGVVATLAWVCGDRAEAPVSRTRPVVTARILKRERLHAEDVIEQGGDGSAVGWFPSPAYSEAVKSTITWLLGDSTTRPMVKRPGSGGSGTLVAARVNQAVAPGV